MRRRALALLVATTGCNEILGLDPTIKLDASPDAPPIHTNLLWAIATTDGMANAAGIDPELAYAPIGSESARPAVPRIQVGDATGLAEVPYNVADGSFEIPYALRTAPHRIVYTLPGESVPHEIQWSIAGAYLTLPRTTRLDAAAVPPGSGYTIMPSGLTGTPTYPTLATSGVFTSTTQIGDFELSGGTFTFRFASKAAAMAGPLGAPQTGHGDWVLVTNWIAQSSTQASVSGWALTQVDLAPNAMTSPPTPPMWMTNMNAPERTLSNLGCPVDCAPSYNAAATKMRIDNALGALAGASCAANCKDHMMYGVSPSLELPGFLAGVAPEFVDRPLIIPFVESLSQDASMTLVDPTCRSRNGTTNECESALPLPRVVYSGVTTTRTVDGVALTSSLQTVSNVFTSPMQYPAPFVRTVQLGSVGLSGAADRVSVPASSSPRELKFQREASYDADDYVVTLYEITSSALAPVRVYHVLEPSVAIDGTLLATGHTYVFGITARHGLPGADRGDYHLAAFPFGIATTFPRTFVIE